MVLDLMIVGRRRMVLSAFTMVEILVVVAIIAVLAAVLFPFAKRALASAREAGCSANLRALGMAFQRYIIDHNGEFFNRNEPAGLKPYIEGLDTWWNYSGGVSRVSCPVVNAMPKARYNSGIYGMNYVLINTIDGTEDGKPTPGIPPKTWPRRSANIEKPQKAWSFTEAGRVLTDGSLDIDPLSYVAYGNIDTKPEKGKSTIVWPHPNGKKNFVFLDGHVETLSWEEVRVKTEGGNSKSPGYKEFYGLK